MMQKTGRHAIIEQFIADGLTHMFGNPGTVEQGFLDALRDYPAMNYVLTLHETVAVMAADGWGATIILAGRATFLMAGGEESKAA
jgi:benzoylformate decarboxylase